MKTNVISNHFDIIYHNAKAKLEAENVRSFIGYLWWVLDPLMSVAVYYLLFKVFLKRGGNDYIPFLFIGLVSWKWFVSALTKGANTISLNKSLYKKIYIPKFVFPFIEIFYQTWKFLVIFVLIVFCYQFGGYPLNIYVFWIPLIVLTQFTLICALTLPLAAIVPFFPDLNFLIGHIMRLLIYPSGVVFAIDQLPAKYQFYIKLNPMAQIIESYRDIIMYNRAPNVQMILIILGYSIALTVLGYFMIQRYDKQYAKLL